jgi:NADP-dependent 3-hydroxy acid dehydrogenase YdfG
MRRWAGRTALITGASSGIGAALTTRLLGEGMQVVACARRQERVAAMLAAADVAEGVVSMLACPDHVQVHDILMRPSAQGT